MAKYMVKDSVPDSSIPYFLTRGKVYDGYQDGPVLVTILSDNEGDEVNIHTGGASFHFPGFTGNPLVLVRE